jgi:type II secretory pathway component PulK
MILEHPLTTLGNPSSINHRQFKAGSVLLVVVLLVALLAAVVMGHLQINTEEIQLVRNQMGGADALAIGEAGLNDALARLRQDPSWSARLADIPFASGAYTVVVDGSTVTSTAVTSRGFVAKIEADVTKSPGGPPCTVQIDRLRINP